MNHRSRRQRHRAVLAAFAAICALMAACGSSDPGSRSGVSTTPSTATQVRRSRQYPSSLVVLGHSGATGLHSDPSSPATDAKQNSWATGDNPTVGSIYLRLLALNPAVRGHNVNLAVDGTGVDQLLGQAEHALATQPRPELFLIQTVDNDIRCDGSDAANYAPFRAKLEAVLRTITLGAPKAEILVLSGAWSTTERYFEIAQHLPGARASNTGPGPCDMFDTSGNPVPAHQRNLEGIALRYLDAVESACAKFPTCRYDKGALHDISIADNDVTPEGFHFTVAGQRKQAALEWRVLGFSP